MHRRPLLAALMAAPAVARAQAFPTRPIRIVAPFAPGGSSDITARLYARHFEAVTGQPGVVDNRPGANGVIGVMAVKTAPPDGHTLVLATTSTHSANPSLVRDLPYDPAKDFVTVGLLPSGGSYLLVRGESPLRSVAELVAAARAAPGALSFGYFNSSSRMPAELMAVLAGVRLLGVPYRVIGNTFSDLLGGRLDFLFVDVTAGEQHVRSGRVRALAVTRPVRWSLYPDIPTLAETWPELVMTGFLGLAAPSATPAPVLARLNALANEAALTEPARSRLVELGLAPEFLDLDACARITTEERVKWARFVQMCGIEPE